MKPHQRILMATDFSEASLPAWKRALAMAKESQTELFVIHAYEPPNVVQAAAVAPFVYEDWNQKVRASASKRLDLLVVEAQTAGEHATGIVEAGNADESIVKAAEDHQAEEPGRPASAVALSFEEQRGLSSGRVRVPRPVHMKPYRAPRKGTIGTP